MFFCAGSTFSEALLFGKINNLHYLLFLNSYFARVVAFWKELTFHSSYFFRRATFSEHNFPEELLFHNILFQKRYYFTVKLLFHSYNSYSSVTNWVSSIPVGCSKSLRILSCVLIIAQSRVIEKVYLIGRLHKVLWNC